MIMNWRRNILIIVGFTFLLHHQATGQTVALPCEGTYVGCYCDFRTASPLLSVTLFNDRESKAVDWDNWNDYSCDLACRCSKEAKAKGYKYFGLSFYGICKSGPGTKDDFKDAWFDENCTGKDGSNHEGCVVGKQSTTAVYAFEEPQ